MPEGDERFGLLLAPVPPGDRVTGSYEPGDDAGTHRTEPNETDVGMPVTSHHRVKRDDAAEWEQTPG